MKQITDIDEINTLLNLYKGGSVGTEFYHHTFNKIILYLLSPNKPNEILYILGVGCKYLKSSFSWKNSNLFVTQHTEMFKGTSYSVIKLIDTDAQFELTVDGGLVLIENVKIDIRVSVDIEE